MPGGVAGAPPTTTEAPYADWEWFCWGIEAASGTDAGGESDKHECLRTRACLGAGSRLNARARPARPIPACVKLRVDKEEKREINIKIAVCCSRTERPHFCLKGVQVVVESLPG